MKAAIGSAILALCGLASACLAAPPEVVALPAPDLRPAVNPDLASDGNGHFLLVWQQGRNYFEQQESDIFALRLDPTGRPLGAPIPVCVEKGGQNHPKVVFADGVFVVVWYDLRNGRDWDVYAARVDVDGKVRDPGGILVAGGPGNQASPAIAAMPGGAFVAWQHYADGRYEIHSALVGASGKPSSARPLVFAGAPLQGGDLSIAGLGTVALLSWKDESKWAPTSAEGTVTRFFARVRPDAGKVEVLDIERAPTPGLGRNEGHFVSDMVGSALYMAWGDIGRGRRIPVGSIFGPRSAVAQTNPNEEPGPRISAWDPRQTLALFSARRQIDGPVAAAYGDKAFLLVARQAVGIRPPYTTLLVGARISPAGARLDDPDNLPVLHETDKAVANPVLAAGPNGFVLVFQQDDGPENQRLLTKNVRLR